MNNNNKNDACKSGLNSAAIKELLQPQLPKANVMQRLEILNYSYMEHFKAEKDISLILPPDHPKRKLLQKHREELLAEIHLLQNVV